MKINFVLKATVNTDQSELMFQLCYKNEIFLWKKKKTAYRSRTNNT